jgi:hypothetical protein
MTIAAIVGPGNIGTDLLVKLQRKDGIDIRYMVGVDPASDGWPGPASSASKPAPAASIGCWPNRIDPIWYSRRPAPARTRPTPLDTPKPVSPPST